PSCACARPCTRSGTRSTGRHGDAHSLPRTPSRFCPAAPPPHRRPRGHGWGSRSLPWRCCRVQVRGDGAGGVAHGASARCGADYRWRPGLVAVLAGSSAQRRRLAQLPPMFLNHFVIPSLALPASIVYGDGITNTPYRNGLLMTANVESLAYAKNRGLPWHRQGNGFAPGEVTSWDDMREKAGLTWEVAEEPVYVMREGKPTEIPRWKNIYRDDTASTLHVAKDSYAIIGHEALGEIIEAFWEVGNAKGNTLDWDTAGSLNGGRQVFVTAALGEYEI